LGTGRTVEYAAQVLDTAGFSEKVGLYSTIVLVNGQGAFRDPTSIVDILGSRFPFDRCRLHLLRLSGLPTSAETETVFSSISRLATGLVDEALRSDIVVASVRPWDWYGMEAGLARGASGRTQPFNLLFSGDPVEVGRVFGEVGVVGIHQMIPLNEAGEDVSDALVRRLGPYEAAVFRPSVEGLASAAGGAGIVLLAASHRNKAKSVRAVVRANLCNALLLDLDLARELLAISA
jgi:hypothetical protein